MKNLKKVLLVLLVSIFVFSLVACGKAENSSENLKIGIIQFTNHPALDDSREGFINQIEKQDKNIEIIYENSQGDISNINNIISKLQRDKVDLIFTIGTPVTQAVKNIEKQIPVVFTAVTDPVAAKIVNSMDKPEANITGVSDLAPIDKQLELFKEIDPDIENIGVIFNNGEINSQIQVEIIEEELNKLGLNMESIGVTNINEVPQAMDSLARKIDGIYTPADNMIASSINVIGEKAIENNLISIGAEKAHLEGGILITQGIDYKDLGSDAGNIALDILLNNKSPKDIAIKGASSSEVFINKTTLESLNIDLNDSLSKAKFIER